MQDLTPVGLSEDGSRLLLSSSSGEHFAVPVDTRLRAALRGQKASSSGRLETKMESALRPRDIQARIRAGESAETVAAAAQTSVEAIMGFATPVLAERAHVAQTAQKASVRRPSHDSSMPARTLGEAAATYFSEHALHDEDVEWDAWRRPDGRWALVASYAVTGRPVTAEFTHDLPGRYVVADNDEARLLTGELEVPTARDGGRTSVARRLSPVPSQDELPLGDDAIELVRDPGPREDQLTLEEALDPVAETADADWIAEPAVDEPAVEGPGVTETGVAEPGAQEPAVADEQSPAAKKKGRSSVPSWDEIMFGGGKQE